MKKYNGPWTTFQPSIDDTEYKIWNIFYITSWCYNANKRKVLQLFTYCEKLFPSSEIQMRSKNKEGLYSIQVISKLQIMNKEHERNNNLSLPDSEIYNQSNVFNQWCNQLLTDIDQNYF
jgi:hypothetical protein